MFRKAFMIVSAFLALVMVLSTVGGAYAQPGNGKGGGLTKHDRELLAEATANGKDTVVVLIAAAPGASRAVASGIESLGGTVRYREDDINYISAVSRPMTPAPMMAIRWRIAWTPGKTGRGIVAQAGDGDRGRITAARHCRSRRSDHAFAPHERIHVD